jgi:hypothetical protein
MRPKASHGGSASRQHIDTCLPHFPPVFRWFKTTKFATTVGRVVSSVFRTKVDSAVGQKRSIDEMTSSIPRMGSWESRKVRNLDVARLRDMHGSDGTELESYANW